MKTHKVLGVIAALFFCCVFSFAALKLPNLTFNSDVLAIFPNDQSSSKQAAVAQSQMSDFISNRLFLLVPASDFSSAYEKAQHISQVFSKSPVVESIAFEQDAQKLDSLLQLYRKYSANFLTAKSRTSMAESASKFIDKNIRRVYMTPSGIGSEAFLVDPFSTAEQFVKKISQLQSSRLNFNEGILSVEDDNVHYVFLQITLAQSAYTLSIQSQVMALLDNAHDYMRNRGDGAKLLASGVVQFAAAGAAQAKSEISVVGGDQPGT